MVIIETPIFTRRIQELIPDEKYRLLQIHLVNRPDAGKTVPGSGGLRKLRWSAGGHGKRGGIRVIYYWLFLVMLFFFCTPIRRANKMT